MQTYTRAESEAAFRTEYQRLLPEGLVYARATVDPATAEDLVQQAFADLWAACYEDGEMSAESATKVFFRILRRRLMDELDRASKADALEDQHVFDITERLEQRQNAALLADGNALADRVQQLVRQFPQEQQKLFEAILICQGDVKAASSDVGIPYPTARYQWWVARKHLATELTRDGYVVPALLPRGRSGGRPPKTQRGTDS